MIKKQTRSSRNSQLSGCCQRLTSSLPLFLLAARSLFLSTLFSTFAMKLPLTLSLTLMAALSSSAHRLVVKKMKPSHPLQRRGLYNSPSDLQVNVASQNSSFDIKWVSFCTGRQALKPSCSTVHDLIYLANVSPVPSSNIHEALTAK